MKRRKFYDRYYGSGKVRQFIKKQFGDASFAVGSGPALTDRKWPFPVKLVGADRVDELLDDGLDVYRPARSTKDTFYIFWDLEYYNRSQRDFVYRKQKEVFKWMEPVLNEITGELHRHGIKYLLDTTASGFHFWTKIRKSSSVFKKMAERGFLTDSIKEKYENVVSDDPKRRSRVGADEAAAYDCAGKLLEYVTHRVREVIQGRGLIPLTVSDAPPEGRTDGFSSDITQYAHPLYMRVFRVIGSLHQKYIMFYGGDTPAADVIKRNGEDTGEVIDTMWDADRAARLLEENDFSLDFSDDGWERLFEDYSGSRLMRAHRDFERAGPVDTDPAGWPAGISAYFSRKRANPSLLDPVVLQKLVNYFTAEGGLGLLKGGLEKITEMYEDNSYGWYDADRFTGIDWTKYDAAQAVHFWGRVFSSQLLLKHEAGIKEEGIKKDG